MWAPWDFPVAEDTRDHVLENARDEEEVDARARVRSRACDKLLVDHVDESEKGCWPARLIDVLGGAIPVTPEDERRGAAGSGPSDLIHDRRIETAAMVRR